MSKFTDPVKAAEANGTGPRSNGFAANGSVLEALAGLTSECIKIVAPDGRLLQMNAAGLEMMGADSWDRVARSCTFDLIAPECRIDWREHHERVCRGERL